MPKYISIFLFLSTVALADPDYSGYYSSNNDSINIEFTINKNNKIGHFKFNGKKYSDNKVGYSFVNEHGGEIQLLFIGVSDLFGITNAFGFIIVPENGRMVPFSGYYLKYKQRDDRSFVPDIKVYKKSLLELRYKPIE